MRPRPTLLVYLCCIASFGLYVPFWIYRTARELDPDPAYRRKHLSWAAGAVIPPIGCLTLFELARLAVASTPRLARFDFLTPALVLWTAVALVLGLLATPLDRLWAPSLLLLPLPVAMVQAMVNHARARASGATGAPARTERPPVWKFLLIAPLGLVAVGIVLRADANSWQRLLAKHHTAGAKLTGASQSYQLTVGPGTWRKVPAGTYGDSDSDLELERVDGASWLVAYAHPNTELDLDGYVGARMAVIEESAGKLAAFEERRYFIDADKFLVGSLARYETPPGQGGTYWVLTAIAAGTGYELMVHTNQVAHDQPAFQALLNSFEMLAERGTP